MKQPHYLNGLYIGQVEQRYGMATAINKQPVSGSLQLTTTGLHGDASADQRHHGGPERALHHYPAEHYAYWQQKYAGANTWQAPGMGENISTTGMTEQTVYLGDRYQWGEAIIEVSQPRSPCFKLNKRWGIEGFSTDMQDISRCGWLYRVIQTGLVSQEQPLQLIDRPANAMSLQQVCDSFFGDPLNPAGLKQLGQQSRLSVSWMAKVQQRLATQTVENWNFRLLGHE
ncbi:MOSC domain-containing protein [Dasania marina]|uniref:MOSC domain-containing protein n=1 Tax=Dasania marina TaxID=471499 RepID=UPI0030DCAEA7|tara:strand:- start:47894 stop:48577 length:684 start_codon:yes stop_codon:yes gene_type:complete